MPITTAFSADLVVAGHRWSDGLAVPREEVDRELRDLVARRVPAVVWGHRTNVRDMHWIHDGFARALKEFGFDTHWVDGTLRDAWRLRGTEEALVITEGQVDRWLPGVVRPRFRVFGHNVAPSRYADQCRYAQFQTENLNPEAYLDPRWGRHEAAPGNLATYSGMYLFWATDMLPREISYLEAQNTDEHAVFVGTRWSVNAEELDALERALGDRSMTLALKSGLSPADHRAAIRRARFAPAVQGAEQVAHGYVACRLFKNISYSQLGVSNNPAALRLFDPNEIVCEADIATMVGRMLDLSDGQRREMTMSAMDRVRREHTYMNRVRELVAFEMRRFAAQ